MSNLYEKAQSARTKKQADFYLNELLNTHNNTDPDELIAILKTIKDNIGYDAGRSSFEHRLLIERIYDTEHPVFGRGEIMGQPTSREAFDCGYFGVTLKKLRDEGLVSNVF